MKPSVPPTLRSLVFRATCSVASSVAWRMSFCFPAMASAIWLARVVSPSLLAVACCVLRAASSAFRLGMRVWLM